MAVEMLWKASEVFNGFLVAGTTKGAAAGASCTYHESAYLSKLQLSETSDGLDDTDLPIDGAAVRPRERLFRAC
jgi:hypothetical protein